jgi:electron transport complex protein RnfA
VLGVALLVHAKEYNLLESVVYGFSIAVGFGLAMVIFSGLREQIEITGTPKGMKGIPIALVTAGILSLAFMGFSGLVK